MPVRLDGVADERSGVVALGAGYPVPAPPIDPRWLLSAVGLGAARIAYPPATIAPPPR